VTAPTLSLSPRDRRALALLAAAVLLALAVKYWPSSQPGVVTPELNASTAERRLLHLRQLAGSAPARLEIRDRLAQELAAREKGIIVAENAAQAQAQLLQVLRRVARNQQPPLNFRSTDFLPPADYGANYGRISVSISGDWGIEQIVNFLSDLGNQPELLASTDLQFTQTGNREKTIPARLVISGLVPRRLLPAKKETAF
jgi:hypothetical protein